jgi:hypothetical protein
VPWMLRPHPVISSFILRPGAVPNRVGYQHDWLTVCQRVSSCKLLVMMGSIQDPQEHLPADLDQGPGCVVTFSLMGLRARYCWAIFYLEGILQSSYHYCLALCKITWLYVQGHAPGPHRDTSSSARRSIRRPKSIIAS